MRLGEICALRWENVDLEKGIIHVKEAVRRVYKADRSGEVKTKLLIHPPKSEKGRRSIPLPAEVLTELKKHRVKQAEAKLLAGNLYNDQGYVFAWEDGRMVDPSFLSRRFKNLVTKGGYEDITFHGLRHSYASALLVGGEHPRVVQELLGDSTVQVVLDIYSHVAPEIKERAAETIDSFLKTKKPPQKKEG
jgi:integrase